MLTDIVWILSTIEYFIITVSTLDLLFATSVHSYFNGNHVSQVNKQ